MLCFVLCLCRDSGDCLELVSGMVGDGFQTQKREVRGSRGKSEQKDNWKVRSRLMGERSGFVNSVRSLMCGRGGVAGVATVTSQQDCVGKHVQAVAAKSGEGSTGSSTSSGEDDRKSKGLEAENKELGAKLEYYEKKKGEGAQGGQGFPERAAWRKSGQWKWTLRMR